MESRLFRILTTLAIGCYNEYGENLVKLYTSPHAPLALPRTGSTNYMPYSLSHNGAIETHCAVLTITNKLEQLLILKASSCESPGLVTCMMEAALDPNTRTIRKMRMSGDMSEINGTRSLSVFFDRKSGTLQAKYTCQEEICNSVGAFMDALRKATEKKSRESVLLKFMLLSIEKELGAASKRYDPEIIFIASAGITAAFALFALLHMITGLLLSKLKS